MLIPFSDIYTYICTCVYMRICIYIDPVRFFIGIFVRFVTFFFVFFFLPLNRAYSTPNRGFTAVDASRTRLRAYRIFRKREKILTDATDAESDRFFSLSYFSGRFCTALNKVDDFYTLRSRPEGRPDSFAILPLRLTVLRITIIGDFS